MQANEATCRRARRNSKILLLYIVLTITEKAKEKLFSSPKRRFTFATKVNCSHNSWHCCFSCFVVVTVETMASHLSINLAFSLLLLSSLPFIWCNCFNVSSHMHSVRSSLVQAPPYNTRSASFIWSAFEYIFNLRILRWVTMRQQTKNMMNINFTLNCCLSIYEMNFGRIILFSCCKMLKTKDNLNCVCTCISVWWWCWHGWCDETMDYHKWQIKERIKWREKKIESTVVLKKLLTFETRNLSFAWQPIYTEVFSHCPILLFIFRSTLTLFSSLKFISPLDLNYPSMRFTAIPKRFKNKQ